MAKDKDRELGNKPESARSEMSPDQQAKSTLRVRLKGNWKIGQRLPSVDEILNKLQSGSQIRRVSFDTQELKDWDSGLLTFLIKIIDGCSKSNIDVDKEGLPEGVRGLLKLAAAVPERKGARRETVRVSLLARIGESAIELAKSSAELLEQLDHRFGSVLLKDQAR